MHIIKDRQKILLTVLISLFTLSGHLFAQDKAAAIKAYNNGLDQAKASEYSAAIESFEKTLDIAKQIGEQDLQDRAIKQLPTMYYQKAVGTYNQFKSDKSAATLREAISEFNVATEVASEYGNSQISNRSKSIITQLTYNLSVLYFQQNKLDSAIAAVNRAINSNANYAKAYYHKALVEKKRGDFEAFVSNMDQAINIGLAVNDEDIVEKAQEKTAGELVGKGVQATENKNWTAARNHLERALNYNSESSDAHFRMAEMLNKRNQYSEALNHAKKALDLESGGKSEKAKIYFELGLAYQGLGNKSASCNALDNAAYGSFKSSAEHKMEFELKCKTLAQSK